ENVLVSEIKNVQLYKELCQKLNGNVIKYCEQCDDKVRTQKVYSEAINMDILNMINIAVRESPIIGRMNSLKSINNVLYACQKTYEEMTMKKRSETPWQESINKKIEQLEMEWQHLQQFDPNSQPSREIKRICGKYHIHSNQAQKLENLRDQIFERITRHKKRLRLAQNRKIFRKSNRNFEFNRKRFYREIGREKLQIDESIDKEQTAIFWRNMWTSEEAPQYQNMLSFMTPALLNMEQDDDNIKKIIEKTIRFLPSWKTPGHDCVYNFFIKKITSLHQKLSSLICEAIRNPDLIDEEFYTGTTFLIAKKDNAKSPNELRPITCLPNLYKLISKIVTTLVGQICDLNDVIADNQMGTKKKCQGAKQQALINKNLNMSNNYDLKSSWIDIQKAYDSVNHEYLVFGRDDQSLKEICWYMDDSLTCLGLKINQQKSASNIESDQVFGEMLDDERGYKYLGILEGSRNEIKNENKQIIIEKIIDRTRKLCESKLNGRNLFHAINEFALSTINYYIGIINFEPDEYERLDVKIRKILLEYGVIRNASNVDRLYLPRNELGRGLGNVAEKSELMLFNLYEYLQNSEKYKAIIESEKRQATHLGMIKEFVRRTYEIPEDSVNYETIINKQRQRRMGRINEKSLHKLLFENENGHIDVRQSSMWLSKGNVSPQEEEMLCKLQDRNLFWNRQRCPHCKRAMISVEHLATHCGGLLSFDYKKRHNDVVRCIHMMFAKKYGITKQRRLKNYRVENVVSNERVRIKSDVPIMTDNRIDHNKPDLMIHDLKTNEIWLIEVGITNKNILPNTEITKTRKYEMLANELKSTLRANVQIVPIVITWDGL
ncbi:hypothetical protein BLA29_002093, partial [Euroglyphus maynei]